MKRVVRWTLRLLLAFVVLLVIGILSLDRIARQVVAKRIHDQTGLVTQIGRVHIGLLHPELSVENLVLYNPTGFGTSEFIDLPELHIEYDRAALMSRKIHCTLVRFNLARVNIVESSNGIRNFEAIQQAMAAANTQTNQHATSGSGSEMEFTGIDKLVLTLGKISYVPMARPNETDQLEFMVKQQTLSNVRAPEDLEAALFIAYLTSKSSGPDTQIWLKLFTPKKR